MHKKKGLLVALLALALVLVLVVPTVGRESWEGDAPDAGGWEEDGGPGDQEEFYAGGEEDGEEDGKEDGDLDTAPEEGEDLEDEGEGDQGGPGLEEGEDQEAPEDQEGEEGPEEGEEDQGEEDGEEEIGGGENEDLLPAAMNLLPLAPPLQQPPTNVTGTVQLTSDPDDTEPGNETHHFDKKEDIYLKSQGLSDGDYYVRLTDNSGHRKYAVSSAPCFTVVNGVINGGTFQLIEAFGEDFSDSHKIDGQGRMMYKVWVSPSQGFENHLSKTKTFKVKGGGSCGSSWGQLKVTKVEEGPRPAGVDFYEVGIYKKCCCGALVDTITELAADEDSFTIIAELEPGSYYLEELDSYGANVTYDSRQCFKITAGGTNAITITNTFAEPEPQGTVITVSKTAEGFREKEITYPWTLTKTAWPNKLRLAQDTEKEVRYTLKAIRGRGVEVKKVGVRGEITVVNAGGEDAQNLVLVDKVYQKKAGSWGYWWPSTSWEEIAREEIAVVDSLEPDGELNYSYEIEFAAQSGWGWLNEYKNVVEATIDNHEGHLEEKYTVLGEKTFSLPTTKCCGPRWEETLVNDSVHLTDGFVSLPAGLEAVHGAGYEEEGWTLKGSKRIVYTVKLTNNGQSNKEYVLLKNQAQLQLDTDPPLTAAATICVGLGGGASGPEPETYTLKIVKHLGSEPLPTALNADPGPVFGVTLWGPFDDKGDVGEDDSGQEHLISEGSNYIDDLDQGFYLVKETAMPEDYELDRMDPADGIVWVGIPDNGYSSIAIYNLLKEDEEPTPPADEGNAITIRKVVTGRPGDDTEFTVRVTGPNGHSEDVKVRQSSPVKMENLGLGDYEIEEISIPSRYRLTGISQETVSFVAGEEYRDVTVTVTNRYRAPSGDDDEPGDDDTGDDDSDDEDTGGTSVSKVEDEPVVEMEPEDVPLGEAEVEEPLVEVEDEDIPAAQPPVKGDLPHTGGSALAPMLLGLVLLAGGSWLRRRR